MAVHGCQHEGGYAQLTARPRVDLGAMTQQELDDVYVATRGRQRQGCVVGDVAVLLVRTTRQQQLNHLQTQTVVVSLIAWLYVDSCIFYIFNNLTDTHVKYKTCVFNFSVNAKPFISEW